MVCCSHLSQCGWLVILLADRLAYSLFHSLMAQAKESVGERQVVLAMWSIFSVGLCP